MSAKQLLIVAHTPSDNTKTLAHALLRGASSDEVTGVTVTLKSPWDVDAQAILAADAVILFTTENFGYMSGALKDLFERIYYPCLDQPKNNEGKPFALVIRAGLDGTGTDIAVHKITAGLKWREVQNVLLCKGEFNEQFVDHCQTLGLTMAASLEHGII